MEKHQLDDVYFEIHDLGSEFCCLQQSKTIIILKYCKSSSLYHVGRIVALRVWGTTFHIVFIMNN